MPAASWGTILGALSALAYTAANVFLRAAVDVDPVWVSAVKAFPTIVFALPWLLYDCRRGQHGMPSRRVLLVIIAAGLVGQVGGNVMFQSALGVIGIALTVPLCLGSVIIFSAILGRVWLGEVISLRSITAMVLLVAAIWILSIGAQTTGGAIASPGRVRLATYAAVLAACISGFAYAVLGAALRYALDRNSSVAATTLTTAVVGVISLGGISGLRLGWEGLIHESQTALVIMLLAGVCNFIAFAALAMALKITSLLYVNVINGSQAAMAAIAGVVLFAEPPSLAMGLGILLTMVGLMVIPRHGPAIQRQLVKEMPTDCLVQNDRNSSSNTVSCESSQLEKPVNSSAGSTSVR